MLLLSHHVTTTAHRPRRYKYFALRCMVCESYFLLQANMWTTHQYTTYIIGEFKYRTLRLKVVARYWLCMVFVIALTWSDRDLTKSLSTWLFCLKAPQSSGSQSTSGSLTLDWAQTLSKSKSRCAFHSPRWPPFMFPAVATSSTSLFSFAALVRIALHWFCLRALESAF